VTPPHARQWNNARPQIMQAVDSKAAPVPGLLNRHERLLVWVGDNANAEALVRHASQWVATTATPWTAIAVHTAPWLMV
jgi:K+-sensing histidine kinase KdpD